MHSPSQKPTVQDPGPPRGAQPLCPPGCEPLLSGSTHMCAHCMCTRVHGCFCVLGEAGPWPAGGQGLLAGDQSRGPGKHLPYKPSGHLEAAEGVQALVRV